MTVVIRSAADTYFIISLVNKHSLKQQVFTKELQLQIHFSTLSHLSPKSSSGETNSRKTGSLFTAHSMPCFP